ncbi:MAG TPA: fatty acid desaturase [Pirellulales bacterium]|nr:fatty acid desaturase [Pirellulales bacterium]
MRAKQLGKTLNSRELNALILPLRYLDNYTNLFYLLADYLTLAVVLVGTATFCHMRGSWGLHWAWDIPVLGLCWLLVGAVQHRFAGLAHEGAHYILLKNRFWNELVSDVFCMFPLFCTTAQYRLIHLGHHEYTNDWERDPELLNMGKTRMMDSFPMTHGEFALHFFARIFWPPTLLRYVWDNIYITTLGNSINPYQKSLDKNPRGRIGPFRLTSMLGIAYVGLMVGVLGYLGYVGSWTRLLVAPVLLIAGAIAVIAALPDDWFFQSDMKPVYSSKFTSVLRLTWITLLECAFAYTQFATGVEWGVYFWLLWILPLFTTFPYYMLLRDLYQHANADDGKLTNSRVIFCNPVVRWAMFIYGQDIHLTHHLYPAVPHYNLRALHRLLVENNQEYAEHVVECHGVLWNRDDHYTALDCMHVPTCEPLPHGDEAGQGAESERVEAVHS